MSFFSFKVWPEEANLVYNNQWLMLASMKFLITLRVFNLKAEPHDNGLMILKYTEAYNQTVQVPCDQLITISKDGKINSENARIFIQKILTQSGVPTCVQDKLVVEFANLAEKMTTDPRFACCSLLPINVDAEAWETVDVMKNSEQCFVCYAQITEGSVVAVMPCENSHVYHPVCAVDWLKTYGNCPLCQLWSL